jgi:hypothetical protein
MTKSAQELLNANGIKLRSYAPGKHNTTCPTCAARNRDDYGETKCLSVKIDAKGATWFCNVCKWSGPEKGKGSNSGKRQELPSYVYRDADGVPRFRKVRNVPGKKPRFWLERPDGKSKWTIGVKGVDTSIIYRADEVKKAIADSLIICAVEGEKDADSLRAVGIAATCNAHGASKPGKKPKWYAEHSEQLRGADLVVFNDNDQQGYEHAEATCKLSLGIAKRVRRLDLAKNWPEIPKGGDVSDWLATGRTADELRKLIETAPDYVLPQGPPPETPPQEQSATDEEIEITRLAKLKPLEYERERKAAVEKLDVRASVLDKLVQGERARLGLDANDGKLQGQAISFPEPEPWPEPVDGARLLDGLAKAIRRHVVMSDEARDETALWVLHAYVFDRFLISPRLGVTSPVKRCGKTTLLDVLGRLAPRALPTANVTAAALFRVVEAYRPTLMVDEADTFLFDNDELRGVLNSGTRKGGTVLRTVGDDHEPRAFNTFCPTVIALIGHLPDTLHDRAVTIELKRALPTEKVEPFRPIEPINSTRWPVGRCDGRRTMPRVLLTPTRRCRRASSIARPTTGDPCWPSPMPLAVSGPSGRARRPRRRILRAQTTTPPGWNCCLAISGKLSPRRVRRSATCLERRRSRSRRPFWSRRWSASTVGHGQRWARPASR